MLKNADRGHYFSLLDKSQMVKLKLKALRTGIWFRALNRIDRALFDLIIIVDIKFRSETLLSSFLLIKNKLDLFIESKIIRAMKKIGLPLAKMISICAQKLGNIHASEWASDLGFVRYLSIMKIGGTIC